MGLGLWHAKFQSVRPMSGMLEETMRTNLVSLFVMAFLVCVTAGCGTTPTVGDRNWNAKVVGVILDADNRPVAGANVRLETIVLEGNPLAMRGQCAGEAGSQTLSGRSGSDGRYSIDIRGADIPLFACLFVEANATISARPVSGVTEVDSVLLGPTGLDSLQVTVHVFP
jgi:hypothetical protein